MRVVILGPPGAGKGTQGALIAKLLGVPHISTGELLRDEVVGQSELGRELRSFMDSGQLVPDAVILRMVGDRLKGSDCEKGFVLDGFPRTVYQAEALTNYLSEIGREITDVVEVSVPDEILLERVESRAKHGSGRSDDKAEILTKRLELYNEFTKPVVGFYKSLNPTPRFVSVESLGTIEEVHEEIKKGLCL